MSGGATLNHVARITSATAVSTATSVYSDRSARSTATAVTVQLAISNSASTRADAGGTGVRLNDQYARTQTAAACADSRTATVLPPSGGGRRAPIRSEPGAIASIAVPETVQV